MGFTAHFLFPRLRRSERGALMAAVASDVYRTVERTVGGLGYQLVDIERLGGGLLRVTLDAVDGVKLEDCERVSRQLSHVLAVEDVDYQRLEVSSPGLDRPLKGIDDFARFIGTEINVQLYAPSSDAGGRKRLRGRLLHLTGSPGAERLQLELSADDQTQDRRAAKRQRIEKTPAIVVEIALADIDKARLVPELDFRPGRKALAGANTDES